MQMTFGVESGDKRCRTGKSRLVGYDETNVECAIDCSIRSGFRGLEAEPSWRHILLAKLLRHREVASIA